MGLSSSRRPRLVPRLNYVDPWDIPAMESWLVQMAAQGLYFVRCSKGLLWFRRDTPGAVRYRLDAISPLSPTPDLETFQQAREMGWLYVGKLGQFSLYRCDDPDAPELHTDPLTQSMTLELLEQSIRRNVSLCTPLFLLGIGMILAGFLGGRPPVLQLVESSASFSMLVSLLLDLIVLVWLLLQCRRFCRLRRSLREGNPMEHRTGRFRGQVARSRFLILFALLFAVLSAGISVRSISGRERWNITPEQPSPLSFHLTHIETDPAFTYRHLYLSDRDMENHVQAAWSLFAPAQYEIEEGGEVPGRNWPDNSGTYSPSFRLSYYRLTLPFLAEPLLRALIREEYDDWYAYELEHEPGRYQFLRVDQPGLDETALVYDAVEDTWEMLFARRGAQVVVLRYYGLEDLSAALPALAQALA